MLFIQCACGRCSSATEFVYRIPACYMGCQGVCMSGMVGILLLTLCHVLGRILELYQKNGLNESKTQISLLPRHTQLSPILLSQLGYSRIKIDHIADSLLKLQIKIGVHLINVELLQLLTPQQILQLFLRVENVSCLL